MQKYLRGQVWYYKEPYYSTEVNSIQKGNRPCIIVSNDIGNENSSTCIVIPCTTQTKTELPTHFKFNINQVNNIALCEQIKTVSKQDLTSYWGTLTSGEVADLNSCIIKSLDLCIEENKDTLPILTPYLSINSPVTPTPSITFGSSSLDIYNREPVKRSRKLKLKICKKYSKAKTHEQKERLVEKYGFSSLKMLIQSIYRWKKAENKLKGEAYGKDRVSN